MYRCVVGLVVVGCSLLLDVLCICSGIDGLGMVGMKGVGYEIIDVVYLGVLEGWLGDYWVVVGWLWEGVGVC